MSNHSTALRFCPSDLPEMVHVSFCSVACIQWYSGVGMTGALGVLGAGVLGANAPLYKATNCIRLIQWEWLKRGGVAPRLVPSSSQPGLTA